MTNVVDVDVLYDDQKTFYFVLTSKVEIFSEDNHTLSSLGILPTGKNILNKGVLLPNLNRKPVYVVES